MSEFANFVWHSKYEYELTIPTARWYTKMERSVNKENALQLAIERIELYLDDKIQIFVGVDRCPIHIAGQDCEYCPIREMCLDLKVKEFTMDLAKETLQALRQWYQVEQLSTHQ
jgi:hypothetical protein